MTNPLLPLVEGIIGVLRAASVTAYSSSRVPVNAAMPHVTLDVLLGSEVADRTGGAWRVPIALTARTMSAAGTGDDAEAYNLLTDVLDALPDRLDLEGWTAQREPGASDLQPNAYVREGAFQHYDVTCRASYLLSPA